MQTENNQEEVKHTPMKRTPKCERCKEREAVWAMQYVGEDRPSFYALGWHIRGFKVTKLCDDCKQSADMGTENQEEAKPLRLSDAIREGSKLRPQNFYGYFDFKGGLVVGSCALGAAYEGAVRQIQYGGGVAVSEELGTLYPFLATLNTSCPACVGSQVPLSKIIAHLNDTHKWSRERVADFVESVESEVQ